MGRGSWIISFYILCRVVTLTQAQQFRIVDGESMQPVPFVSVHFVKAGEWLMSDSSGMVKWGSKMQYNQSEVEVLRVGYKKIILSFHEFSDLNGQLLYLEPQVSHLKTVDVRPEVPEQILANIRKKLKSAFDTVFVINSFYRQFHIENDRPVFMVEADVDVLFSALSGGDEKVKVNHVRRMTSSEQNGEKHSDHLIDLLYMNPVTHPGGSLLNIFLGKEIRWPGTVKDTVIDGETAHVLLFERPVDGGRYTECGKIVYNSDFQLLEYSYLRLLNPEHGPEYDRYAGKYAWLKLSEQFTCIYSWKDGLMHPRELFQTYTHLLFHTVFHQPDFELTEDFFWSAIKIKPESKKESLTFKAQGNLYEFGIREDQAFFTDDYLSKVKPVDRRFTDLFTSFKELQLQPK